MQGHQDRVWHLSWHPSLPVLASCSGDRSVRVWSPNGPGGVVAVLEWSCVAVLDDFTTRTVRCVEWSRCGRMLAASSFDGTVTVWDVSGSALREGGGATASTRHVLPGSLRFKRAATLRGHDNEVKGLSWSAAGDMLATCGRDMSVWVWAVIEGNREDDEDEDDQGSAADGSGGGDAEPIPTDFECIAVLHGHDADVKSIAFHPYDEFLVSSSYDNSLHSWSPDAMSDWAAVQKIADAHASTVWSFSWAPDGGRGASVGDDGALKTWSSSAATGPTTRTVTFLRGENKAHERTAFSVHWSPCGSFIATGGADNAAHVFNADTLARLDSKLGAHSGDVNCVRWFANSSLISTAGDDGSIRLWKWEK